MKYREYKIDAVRKKEFGTEQINHKKKLKFIWDKRTRRERDWWKIFWKNISNCFGDGKCCKGENLIWRTAKKERWKDIAKHKSIKKW
jgi:hypothetical protein